MSLPQIPITFLNTNQIKRVIPCYKEHDTSFIWYYYTYHISKAILDLDPDLCQNFLFFVTSSILHIETCMIPLSKAVHKGFILFLHLRALSNYGDVMTQKLKKLPFLLVTMSFLLIESSVIPALKAFYEGLHFFFLHWWAMPIYEDIMTEKHENLMI